MAYTPRTTTKPATPKATRHGWRFTRAAKDTTNGFGTQVWEKNQLDGDALGTGAAAGACSWEDAFGAARVDFGLGAIRAASSPDRQYLAEAAETSAPVGTVRDWRSTTSAIAAIEVVVPSLQLGEIDTPGLIPVPLQKYLRYYVLSRAFGREGEGHRPDMAVHYELRFHRGVALMRRLADAARRDHVYAREALGEVAARPPLVRLPATFPSVW